MLGVTAAIAAVGVWSLRKELVRSSEAFSVLSVVLVGLDFAAGHEGGLFGTSISGTGAQWITAILIALSGLGWAIAAQRAAAMRLVGAQVLAGLGVFALALLTLDERLARDEYISLSFLPRSQPGWPWPGVAMPFESSPSPCLWSAATSRCWVLPPRSPQCSNRGPCAACGAPARPLGGWSVSRWRRRRRSGADSACGGALARRPAPSLRRLCWCCVRSRARRTTRSCWR